MAPPPVHHAALLAFLYLFASTALATPAPTAFPGPRPPVNPAPLVTGTPTLPFYRRQILSDIESFGESVGGQASSFGASIGGVVSSFGASVGGDASSVGASIGGEASSFGASVGGGFSSYLGSILSGASSYVASGVQSWEVGLPTGSAVISSAGINSSTLSALPTSVLNFPPYANWTEQGWNVRFHGNVYKQPNISRTRLDELANAFLIGTRVQDLPAAQSSMAINVTQEIFVVQQGNVQPIFDLSPAPEAGSSGEPGGGGASTASGGTQTIVYPDYNTTDEGDFDAFIPIALNGLTPGNETLQVQRLSVHTQGTDTGNATAYLVPPTGLTIVSDIDDILRITKIYDPAEGILNTFARNYTPWENMPSIYSNWSANLVFNNSPVAFHYLSTLPEQVTRQYEAFIYSTYPGGSFDTRPLNFSDVSATLSIRKFLLDKLFQTFPQRRFVLVADTSNSDVMKDYPAMWHEYPGQVQCILLRNTTATDPADHFPYDTSGFEGIPQGTFMFFVHSDDLTGIDIAGGDCWNRSVIQNVTFGEQGLPFGINLGDGTSTMATASPTGASPSSSTGAAAGRLDFSASRDGAGVFVGWAGSVVLGIACAMVGGGLLV